MLGKAKAFETISTIVFGEGEEEKTLLPELAENVHMALFLVMVVFILTAFYLAYRATRQIKKWQDDEAATRSPQEANRLKREWEAERDRTGLWARFCARARRQRLESEVLFLGLRHVNPS